MRERVLFSATLLAAVAVVLVVLSVSIEKRKAISPLEGSRTSIEITDGLSIDSVGDDPMVESLSDTGFTPLLQDPIIRFDTLNVDFSHVNCATVLDGRAVAGTDGGVFIYDPADSSIQIISAHNGLSEYRVTALLADSYSLYIGTENGLFVRNDNGDVIPLIPEVDAHITALALSADTVYIGTANRGLLAFSGGSAVTITEKAPVTDIVAGNGNLWVSIYGEGLFTYDGNNWKRRFLEDDTTAFDRVAALGYRYDRLFAGTSQGLWVFDGGSWDMYDPDDGLFACDITSIDFKGWKILVGSRTWGHFEIFEEWVTPMYWTEAMEITAVASDGNVVVVGTPDRGILVQNGKEVTMVNPGPDKIEIPVWASSFM